MRGPQYVSSLGDLSNKYLNELVLGNAIRLRDLKVGDDRDGYRNEALTSCIVGSTGESIKGLLRLVDLSNLSNLTLDPQISACNKLEIIKLLGTKIGAIEFPKGNVLTTIYLPDTVTEISLEKPLKLTNILTVKPTHVTAPATDPTGLYIDNLTNLLPTFESAADKFAVFTEGGALSTNIYTKINKLQLDDTKLAVNYKYVINLS